LSILLFSLGLCAGAQPFSKLRWTLLTEKDGLSCDKATDVTQDSAGVIWISTYNGLNRFDGYGCARYFSKLDDSASLLDNDVQSMYYDGRNGLWLATASGMCHFNIATHRVTRFQSGPATPAPFATFDNSRVWFDEKGRPFVGSSSAGLFQFTDEAH